jgi:hypothetical protein
VLGGVFESGVCGGVGTGSWVGGVPGIGPDGGVDVGEVDVGSLGCCVLAGAESAGWLLGSERAGLEFGELAGCCGCAVGAVGSGGVGAVCGWAAVGELVGDEAGSCALAASASAESKLSEISDLRNNIEYPTESAKLRLLRLRSTMRRRIAF